MAMTRTGELRDRVAFFRPLKTDDGAGNTEIGFAATPDFPPVAAAIVPRLGGERVLAGRLTGTDLVNVTLRASSAACEVTTAWKLRDLRRDVEYNIRSIIDPYQATPERGRYIEMLCEQGVAL